MPNSPEIQSERQKAIRQILETGPAATQRSLVDRSVDALAARMQRFHPLPFEDQLRRGDPAAIIATGGLTTELAARLDAQRLAWAGAWAAGDPAADDAAMTALYQLTRTIADAAELLRLGEDAIVLNRWAAWEPESRNRPC